MEHRTQLTQSTNDAQACRVSATLEAAGMAAFVALPVLAMIAAAAWIWLTLHNPLMAADIASEGRITPLVRDIARVVYHAVLGIVEGLS